MRELSQHITDLIENSVRAGAKRVGLTLIEDTRSDLLTFSIEDDGCGMPPEMVARVLDPFCTTRTCRKVGLGLPLLAASTERCEGSIKIESCQGRGTTVTAVFRLNHIDRPPLGDLHSTLLTALVGHSEVDFHLLYTVDGRSFELDGQAIKRELDGLPLSHPLVLGWLERYLSDCLAELGGRTPPSEEDIDGESQWPG